MTYLKTWKNCLKLLLSCTLLASPMSAIAFTLEDAMILAHENNYKVLSEVKNYDATMMQKPKAYAGFLPTAAFNHTNAHVKYPSVGSTKNSSDVQQAVTQAASERYYRQYGFTVSQPLFTGGSTYAQVKIAENAVEAELSNFKDVSSSITVSAVQAYEGVLSAREIYDINVENEKIYEKYLEFTKIRFEAGVITRTDVLQAEVRLSDAKAQKETAYANMRNFEANFEHIIGVSPTADMEPVVLDAIKLPERIDELIDVAKTNNPTLKTSTYNAKAAKYQVNAAVAQILPTVSANASVVKSTDQFAVPSSNSYTLNVNVPIFQGGGEYANILQQKSLAQKANLDQREVERQIIENAIAIWNNTKTTKSIIKARFDAITAADKALEGVREEVNVGTRTTIDLLNAQSELFNAKVNYRTSKVNLVISVYQMLQVMGQIDPINLEYEN